MELWRSLLDCQNVSFNSEFLPKKFLLNDVRLFPTATAPDLCDGIVEKACRKGIGGLASFRQHCRHTVLASRPAIERDSPGRRLMAACGRGRCASSKSCHTFRPRDAPRQGRVMSSRLANSPTTNHTTANQNMNNYACNSSRPHGLLYI